MPKYILTIKADFDFDVENLAAIMAEIKQTLMASGVDISRLNLSLKREEDLIGDELRRIEELW